MRAWVNQSIARINADYQRSGDTHLIKLDLPELQGVDLYLKDESTHPTGSLKHRLARSLFLYALCNGKIKQGTPVIEASSGSTAVSEAYFARMIGVPFIAVMPKRTAKRKVELIEQYGGRCHFVESASQMHAASVALAQELGGHFMDQFANAERATDWRGSNNIAESIFSQMACERYPVPRHIVMGAGTGGTSATLGRYIRYRGLDTELTVVDPEHSVFFDAYEQKDLRLTLAENSRIEGIGRPLVEESFQPDVIDRMLKVSDLASITTMLWLYDRTGRKAGPSTGTNLWGALHLARQMISQGEKGSVVTLMCDGGERYPDTYYNPGWVSEHIGR